MEAMDMTEAEWLACQEPSKLVRAVPKRSRDRGRKLRLFAAACCRRIWENFGDERSRKSVETAENLADGKASPEELAEAHRLAHNVVRAARRRWIDAGCPNNGPNSNIILCAAEAASRTSYCHALDAAACVTLSCELAAAGGRNFIVPRVREKLEQLRLVHCIFGNPFRVVRVAPAWLAWRDGTIVKLAQTIYEERAFDQLPILADALEEAGCDNIDILNHCRQPGEHARGCWVVDLALRSKK